MGYAESEVSVHDLITFFAEMPIEDGQGHLADVTGPNPLARQISELQTTEVRHGGA